MSEARSIRAARLCRTIRRSTADLCVVGTGAGGAMVAREAARAGPAGGRARRGRRTRQPRDFTQREDEMLPLLFQDARRAHHRRRRDHRAARAAASAARRCTTPTSASARPRRCSTAGSLDGWRAARARAALRGRRARSVGAPDRARAASTATTRFFGAASRSSAGGAACSRTTAAAASARASASSAAPSTPSRTRSRCWCPRRWRPARGCSPTAAPSEILVEGGRAVGVRGARARRDGAARPEGDGARARCASSGSAVGSARAGARERPARSVGPASAAACACTRARRWPASSTSRSKAGAASRRATSAPRSCASTRRRRRPHLDHPGVRPPDWPGGALPGFGAAHMTLMRLYPRLAVFVAMLHDRLRRARVGAQGRRPAQSSYALERRRSARAPRAACARAPSCCSPPARAR